MFFTSQSSIHKPKSSVSNIILNKLSNSLSKWFSPSDQNGNLRRKRETDSDLELNDMTHGTVSSTSEPPSKRFRCVENQVRLFIFCPIYVAFSFMILPF